MGRRTVLLAVAAVFLTRLLAAQRSADANVRAGFDGIWNSATATPLERPPQLKDKAFFTPEEAARVGTPGRRAQRGAFAQAPRRAPAPAPTTRSTASSARAPSRRCRTSIVTDPPDGRIPALTPAAADDQAPPRRSDEECRERRRIPVFRISAWRSSPPGRRCCRIPTTATTRSCRPGTRSSCMRR